MEVEWKDDLSYKDADGNRRPVHGDRQLLLSDAAELMSFTEQIDIVDLVSLTTTKN